MTCRSAKLRQVSPLNKHFVQSIRSIVSALHTSGGKPNAAVSILTPSLTHIDTLIRNKPKLVHMLEARKMPFDVDSFVHAWDEMNRLRTIREDLETKRNTVTDCIKLIVKNKNRGGDSQLDFEELKEQGKQLRVELKKLSARWWTIEEKAVTAALSLPNYLHARTPSENHLIESHRPFPEAVESHCNNENIKFSSVSPTAYYLRGPLAHLELDWIQSFSQAFVQHNAFHLITGADFVKSVIVDGCGLEFNDPEITLCLTGSQDSGNLHLVGGGSLASVAAFLTKNSIETPFPMRLLSIGRQYQPPPATNDNKSLGLFNATQSSAIQLLTAMENHPENLYEESQRISSTITNQLVELNVHFRVVNLAAGRLERWEQYRCSFQMYSSTLKDYVEVASVSIVGDFISRRLAIYGPQRTFPGFVTSKALCVSKLLAAYLENQ